MHDGFEVARAAIGDESGEGEEASCFQRDTCEALRGCEAVEDAGIGFFFLCLDEDVFELGVGGAVVDDERNLGFLCGEDVVAEGGFL